MESEIKWRFFDGWIGREREGRFGEGGEVRV